jgi:site-specific DNA-cytosine methylase
MIGKNTVGAEPILPRILSLFDGMSCGQIALNKIGYEYGEYYASEIDKYAMQVAQKNYPNTKQIGSVTEVNGFNLPKIELFYGGSPCQSFSRSGDNTGFEGKSGLFWEYVRVLKEVQPKYFLLENVLMKKEWEDVITEALGVKPIEIKSSLFVPQARRRLYWTNIPNIEQPTQVVYDIEDFIDGDGFASSCGVDRVFKRKQIFNTLTATYWKGIRGSSRPAVSTSEGFLDDDRSAHRMLSPNECERLQTVPLDYTDGVSKTQRFKMLGNGWTVDAIAHIFSFIPKGSNELLNGIKK